MSCTVSACLKTVVVVFETKQIVTAKKCISTTTFYRENEKSKKNRCPHVEVSTRTQKNHVRSNAPVPYLRDGVIGRYLSGMHRGVGDFREIAVDYQVCGSPSGGKLL